MLAAVLTSRLPYQFSLAPLARGSLVNKGMSCPCSLKPVAPDKTKKSYFRDEGDSGKDLDRAFSPGASVREIPLGCG